MSAWILEKGERADPCYGLQTEYITEEEIEDLRAGKRLYISVNGGEYAVVVKKRRKKDGRTDELTGH